MLLTFKVFWFCLMLSQMIGAARDIADYRRELKERDAWRKFHREQAKAREAQRTKPTSGAAPL